MATKIGICNLALGWLGSPPIAALTENRPEARYAAQYYDLAVEMCLRDHRWNFAQKRKRLAGIALPEAFTADFRYAYALPVDVAHAHTLIDPAGNELKFDVALGEDGASRMILANDLVVYLKYTALVTVTELFDPHFTRAVARRLAADIAIPILKNNPQKVQELEALYDRAIQMARLSDYREGEAPEEEEISWITSRTGGRG